MDYATRELSPEEMMSVTKEMQEVLEKYDCELQVISNIHILKRVPGETPESASAVKSPYDGTNPETPNDSPETNPQTEESGEVGDGEPAV